jgi:putative phage-type endonuclease
MTAAVDAPVRAWPDGPVVIAPDGQPRSEWLATRRRGIGGSDVAGILGLSRYSSPLSTYMDKRGELGDSEMGEAAEWGILLEPVILDKWATERRVHVWKPGLVAHPNRPWQLANLDGVYTHASEIVEPEGGVEIKTTNQYLSQDWDPDSDRMPDPARLQVQHYMDCTGLRTFDVAALIGGQQFRVFTERYDQELAEMVRAEMDRFWHEHVLPGNPPPIDGSNVTTDLLGRLWEVDPENVTVLDPAEVRPLLEKRAHAKAVIDGAKADLDLVENQMKSLLGPKQVGVVDGQPVITWKQQTRAAHAVKESTFRVLRIPKGALDAF